MITECKSLLLILVLTICIVKSNVKLLIIPLIPPTVIILGRRKKIIQKIHICGPPAVTLADHRLKTTALEVNQHMEEAEPC